MIRAIIINIPEYKIKVFSLDMIGMVLTIRIESNGRLMFCGGFVCSVCRMMGEFTVR